MTTRITVDELDVSGFADALILDANGDTTVSAPVDDQVDFEVGGADVGFLHAEGWMGPTFAFVAENTSGGAVAANSTGYIDEAGEFKLSSVDYEDVNWCTVIEGGANNADIYVARRGRVTIELTANCAVGDFLYMANSVGNQHRARPETYMRPEVFAVARTANAGGAGGTCSALLYCHRTLSPTSNANDILRINGTSDSDWSTTIAGLPGGAVVTYTIPFTIAGSEDCIVPAAVGELGKLVLHNTTRGDYGLIQAVNIGVDQITLTAAVPGGWIVGDSIQVRSTTAILAPPWVWFDVEITSIAIPALAVALVVSAVVADAANATINTHPYEAAAPSKRQGQTTVGGGNNRRTMYLKLTNRRFCYGLDASGVGTTTAILRLSGVEVASP